MSKMRIMDGWECGMCFELIDNRPHVRIAVDMAVELDINGVSSLMDDEVMVLAVFHTACISDTLDDEELEKDVPYLRAARMLVQALDNPLDNRETKKPVPPLAKIQRAGHLRVLNGGAQ